MKLLYHYKMNDKGEQCLSQEATRDNTSVIVRALPKYASVWASRH